MLEFESDFENTKKCLKVNRIKMVRREDLYLFFH